MKSQIAIPTDAAIPANGHQEAVLGPPGTRIKRCVESAPLNAGITAFP